MLISLALAAEPLVFENAPRCEARSVEIAMVGDVMQHGMQLEASTQPDGTYSWRGVFAAITPLIAEADLAIANLETPVAPGRRYAGFPLFNAPEEILVALRTAGFDVLQTANNHCLDRGRGGLMATLDTVKAHGMRSVGTWPTEERRQTPWEITVLPGPVRVAFLAYTYGTNGEPMPKGEPWTVDWIDPELMHHDVRQARQVADIVIVGLHWGAEYQHAPLPHQVKIARELVDAGADVVMGSHPHVIQPGEVHSTLRPEGRRDGLILYSLGNFVSNQRTPNRDGGLLARVTVATCVDSGAHHVVDARFTPIWVDNRLEGNTSTYRVLPVIPPDAPCPTGLDLSESDCRRMHAFRDHTATLFHPAAFSWTTAPTAWTAKRPRTYRPSPWMESPYPVETPVPTGANVWPPRALQATQGDAAAAPELR